MKTPYSSFTSVNKYLTKDYPIPVSSLGDAYQEPLDLMEGEGMDYFNLGDFITDVGDFAKKVADPIKNVVAVAGSIKGSTTPPLTSGQVKAAAGSGVQYVQTGSNSNDTLNQLLQMQLLQTGSKKDDSNSALMWGGIGLGVLVLVVLIVKMKG